MQLYPIFCTIGLSDDADQPPAEHVEAAAVPRKTYRSKRIAEVEPPDLPRTEART